MAKNVVFSYARSVAAIVFALLGGRWLLAGLGQSDFGIYSVVGSLLVFVVFLNGVLSGSVARYYSYSSDCDSVEVNAWFNVALSVHVVLAFALVTVGYFVGNYMVGHVLNVPQNRRFSAMIVLDLSLVSAFFSMVATPFLAMFVAKQKIHSLALWGMMQSVLTFCISFFVGKVNCDRLVFYAASVSIMTILLLSGQVVQAYLSFNECQLVSSKWWDRRRMRDLFAFSGWNLFGGVGTILRNQGAALLLNLNYGTVVNSAFGIANQLAAQADQLAGALLGAMSPEITASEGRGERSRVIALSMRASKLGTIFVMLFSIPMLIEIDVVLRLWLHVVPEHAAGFCRVLLVSFVIDRMSTGQMIAVNAKGIVAGYQMTVGGLLLLTLPIAWLIIQILHVPESVSYAYFITTGLCVFGRVWWGKRLIGIDVEEWVKKALIPCVVIFTLSYIMGYAIHCVVAGGILQILLVTAVSDLVVLAMLWFVFLDNDEKLHALRWVDKLVGRVRISFERDIK